MAAAAASSPQRTSPPGCISAKTARSASTPGRPKSVRTSARRLTQVVAEELHAAPESIHMVMADTQLTPYDMGTFGSRTTPDMSQRLRRTAAAAREMLIDLAAETWKADRALLSADKRHHRPFRTGQKLEFGKLTKGQKLTKDRHRRRRPRRRRRAGRSPAILSRKSTAGRL